MANTYTVRVVVEVVGDNPLEAFRAIRTALEAAKLAEIIVVQPLQVTQTILGDDDPDLAVIDSLD